MNKIKLTKIKIKKVSIIITFTEFKEFATLFSNQSVSWEDWISQENDVFANGTAYDATGGSFSFFLFYFFILLFIYLIFIILNNYFVFFEK